MDSHEWNMKDGRWKSRYPEEKVLLGRINRPPTSNDLQKKNPKCKNISLFVNDSMHEVLGCEVSECPLDRNHSVVTPFVWKPLCKPKVSNLYMHEIMRQKP
jgi:hypothetical protein